MNWSEIRVLYARELKSALRERTIVINTILLPIFLYPVLLWVMFTGITFVQGMNEGFESRVAVVTPLEGGHASLINSLTTDPEIVFWAGFKDRAGEAFAFRTSPAELPIVSEEEADAQLEARVIVALVRDRP